MGFPEVILGSVAIICVTIIAVVLLIFVVMK